MLRNGRPYMLWGEEELPEPAMIRTRRLSAAEQWWSETVEDDNLTVVKRGLLGVLPIGGPQPAAFELLRVRTYELPRATAEAADLAIMIMLGPLLEPEERRLVPPAAQIWYRSSMLMMKKSPFQKTEMLAIKLLLLLEPKRVLLYWLSQMRGTRIFEEKGRAILQAIEEFEWPAQD